MAGVPSGHNTWKTILIGVISTFLAYLFIHFIFDRKESRKKEKEKKEKIESAWNSVNEYINRSQEKFTTIGCYSCDELQMKTELLRELDQMNKSLQNIKEGEELDDKLKSIIDRTIQMFEDEKPVLSGYYDSLASTRHLTDEQRQVVLSDLQQAMFKKINYIQTRDTADFNAYLEDLNHKYKLQLERKNLLPVVLFDELPGVWEVECAYRMNIKADNRVSIKKDKDTYTGIWDLNKRDKTLTLHFDDGSELEYSIIQLNKKMMALYLSATEILIGACKK